MNGGLFPLLQHLAPPPNTNDDIEQFAVQGGITVQGDLNSSTDTQFGPTAFPFTNERMAPVSSCIVG